MNARTSVGSPSQVEPTSIAEANAERDKLIPQIEQMQAALSGIGAEMISSFGYQRRRAENVARTLKMQQRAGFLRRWIASHQTSSSPGVDRKLVALAAAYNLLVRVQESDTGSPFTTEIETCLAELELFVPVGLITEEAKPG